MRTLGLHWVALSAAQSESLPRTAAHWRFGTYSLPGSLHMHLWRDRFYETNGHEHDD